MTRKYTLNEHIFDTFTADSMYLIGFIYADGYVAKNTIEICLGEKDLDHLYKINSLFESNAKISKRHNQGLSDTIAYRLTICSKRLCNKLRDLGFVKQKTKNYNKLKIPKNHLFKHFVRGYFDGDGGVWLVGPRQRKTRKHIVADLIGHKQFLEEIQNEFIKSCEKRKSYGSFYAYKHTSIELSSLRFDGSILPCQFLNWIYKDSAKNNRMDRKHNVLLDFLTNHASLLVKDKFIDMC